MDTSAVAWNAVEAGHKFKDSGKLLVSCSDRGKLSVLEWMEIYKKQVNLLNSDIEGLNNCLFKFLAGNT